MSAFYKSRLLTAGGSLYLTVYSRGLRGHVYSTSSGPFFTCRMGTRISIGKQCKKSGWCGALSPTCLPIYTGSPREASAHYGVTRSTLGISSSRVLKFICFPCKALGFPLRFAQCDPLGRMQLEGVGGTTILASRLFFSLGQLH